MSGIGFLAFGYVAIGLSFAIAAALHTYRSGTLTPPKDLSGSILEVYLLTLVVLAWPAFLAASLWRNR